MFVVVVVVFVVVFVVLGSASDMQALLFLALPRSLPTKPIQGGNELVM